MTKTKIRTRTSGAHKGKRYPLKNQGPQGYSTSKGSPTSKGVTREDLRKARDSKQKMDRNDRMIAQWNFEHAGDTDMSFIHKRKKIYEELDRLSGFGSEKDTISKDIPRRDIISFIGSTGRKVYVGGENKSSREELLSLTKHKLDNYFTISEVKEMGPLYIQAGGESIGSGGSCQHLVSIKHRTHITGKIRTPHIISISEEHINDAAILTHEFVHAKRWGTKDHVSDINREEKETDLETMCRLSPSDFDDRGGAGYYQFIPEVREELKKDPIFGTRLMWKFQKDDRQLVIGKKPGMKGVALKQKINKVYNKTHISDAQFSQAEKLDRFFIIKSKELTLNEHNRYIRSITLEEIKQGYRETYPGAKVWEIRDGVKVRII